MRIALDVDGVLCDHVLGVEKWIRDRYGIRFTKREVVDWDYNFGPSTLVRELKLAYSDPGLLRSLPAVRGAREAVRFLSESHDVFALSNRPLAAQEATAAWLEAKIAPLPLVLARASKLGSQAEVLVDDYPGHVEEFARVGRLGLLFDQPWNRHFLVATYGEHDGSLLRAKGWRAAVRIIEDWNTRGTKRGQSEGVGGLDSARLPEATR